LYTNCYFLSLGRKGGQVSSEDLLPLGYGERERIKVRVKKEELHSMIKGLNRRVALWT